jgi:nitroreductase
MPLFLTGQPGLPCVATRLPLLLDFMKILTFDEILDKRRSVRAFDPTPVPPRLIEAIGEAARMAPSACNSQTWRFIAVTDPRTIRRICLEAMRPVIQNRWLSQAPLVMVGCSRLDVIANRIGKGVTGIEYYQIDLGIAMEHMVLKATELGLGTCWIGWFKEDRIRKILEIPERIKVSALLAVGYGSEARSPRRLRKPLRKILFSESWGNAFRSTDEG